MASDRTYIFRVSLKAKIYREIEIEGSGSLANLAEAIIGAFDFDFDHAFGFYSKLTGPYHQSPERYELFADMEDTDSDAGSVERTKVSQAFAKTGKKMLGLNPNDAGIIRILMQSTGSWYFDKDGKPIFHIDDPGKKVYLTIPLQD